MERTNVERLGVGAQEEITRQIAVRGYFEHCVRTCLPTALLLIFHPAALTFEKWCNSLSLSGVCVELLD